MGDQRKGVPVIVLTGLQSFKSGIERDRLKEITYVLSAVSTKLEGTENILRESGTHN